MFYPGLRIAVLCFLLTELSCQVTPQDGITSASLTTVVNCNSSTTHSELPTPVPSEASRVIQVHFDRNSSSEVNCSWTIPAYNNDAFNVIDFKIGDQDWCHQYQLYDVNPQTGNQMLLARACEQPMVSGRIGFPTLLVLVAKAFSQGTVTILSYSSVLWDSALCGQENFIATLSKTVIQLPDATHPLPKYVECSWNFLAPEKGVVNIRLFSSGESTGNVSSLNVEPPMFVIWTPRFPDLTGMINLPMTRGGLDFEHVEVTGFINLDFLTDNSSVAPPFTLTYWADGMQVLCPSSVLALQATDHLQAFKGVNHDLDSSADRVCFWIISAPSGQVVNLVELSNWDYRFLIGTEDWLMLNDGSGRRISLKDWEAFPLWSWTSTLLLHFHVNARTPRSEFIITYRAVSVGICQSRPVQLIAAAGEWRKVSETALQRNDTVNGSDCQWLVTGQEGFTLQVSVKPQNQQLHCSQSWSSLRAISVYSQNQRNEQYRLQASCSSQDNTATYKSKPQSDVMLVVYNRDPSRSDVMEGVTILYTLLSEPTVDPWHNESAVSTVTLSRSLLTFLSFIACYLSYLI